MAESTEPDSVNERLVELYERNDKIEKELNKLSHTLKSSVKAARKDELLRELQQVIDEIEQLEPQLEARNDK